MARTANSEAAVETFLADVKASRMCPEQLTMWQKAVDKAATQNLRANKIRRSLRIVGICGTLAIASFVVFRVMQK